MVRKFFRITDNDKIDQFVRKYKIPREYLVVNRKSITKGIFVGLFWGFIPMPCRC